MGKDSFAGEVAKEALVVFDPLGIAEETLKREKKAEAEAEEPRTEPEETTAKAEKEEALPEEDPEAEADAASSEAPEKEPAAPVAEASPAAEASPSPTRGEKSVSWSNFFGGKKREKTQTAERETEAGGQLNDVVAIPRNAQPGDDEMEDAFMAFGAPTRKRPPPGFTPPGAAAAAAEAEAKKSASKTEPANPRGSSPGSSPGTSSVGLPSGKRGVSSFLNSRAGASSFATTKPSDPNSVEAIQYRKDMANAKAAGVPYSTWVKKSREDLSTLTWQELAERMKKPYDPDARAFTDDAGAR